jgi:hypothetical protein
MKVLDYAGAGLKAAKGAVSAVAKAVIPRRPVDPVAAEELRRRAEVNARGDAIRAEREAAFFDSSRWLSRRPGWLGRGR